MYIKKKNKNKPLIFRGEIVNNNFEFYYLQIIKNPPRKPDIKHFVLKQKKIKICEINCQFAILEIFQAICLD